MPVSQFEDLENSYGANDMIHSFGRHFEELRSRIIRIAFALVAGWVIGWCLQPYVYKLLSEAAHALVPTTLDYKETFRNITDPFMLKMKLAFYIGAVVVLPFCIFEIWQFVAPGLKPKEKKQLMFLIPISILLFGLGCCCCWAVLPSAIGWLAGFVSEFPGTVLYQESGTLVFFIIKMMLAFGLGFQLPTLVFIAAKLGLVTPQTLLKYWRHVVVAIFIVSMIFVPSADPMSLLMLAVPLSLLFFLSVAVVYLMDIKQRALLRAR